MEADNMDPHRTGSLFDLEELDLLSSDRQSYKVKTPQGGKSDGPEGARADREGWCSCFGVNPKYRK